MGVRRDARHKSAPGWVPESTRQMFGAEDLEATLQLLSARLKSFLDGPDVGKDRLAILVVPRTHSSHADPVGAVQRSFHNGVRILSLLDKR